MKRVLGIILVICIMINTTPIFGQENNSVTITDTSFDECGNSTIEISGTVTDFLNDIPITVKVIAPNNNIIAIDQIDINEDNTFQIKLSLGNLLREFGTHTVKIQHGQPNRVAETIFEHKGIIDCGWDPHLCVDCNRFYPPNEGISHDIIGGKIIKIDADTDVNSIIVTIVDASEGSITLGLPRAILDATNETGEDVEFIVLVDGKKVSFDETVSSTERTLTIEFQAGSEEIEIISTFVIPEFGTIVTMILVVAIVSIIAISAKSKLSIMPRY